MKSGAILIPIHFPIYRYLLWRTWDENLPKLGVMMNNPSDADAEKNDPTIYRLIHFATINGFGEILVANMYGYRTPSPKALWLVQDSGKDAVGPANDTYVTMMTKNTVMTLLAYGNLPRPERVDHILNLLKNLGTDCRHLGLTNSGRPKHPLSRGKSWIPDTQQLEPYLG